jgi:small subunit ribosomal protein S1
VQGARLKGTVRNVRDFGAFVDLGGIDGLVHVSELSWERVENAADVLKPGDEVEVMVLSADWDKNRVALSMRACQADPWETAVERFPAGSTHEGKVQRLADYGAFVELMPGLDGLVHISELDWKRVTSASEVVSVGDRVQVRVLEVDPARKRIALSVKQASGVDPWLTAGERYHEGATVEGTVEKIEAFGVFVTVEPGLTALLPMSESGTERGSDLRRYFRPGQSVTAQVLSVSPEERRMSLSLSAAARSEERAEVESYQRRTAEPRRERKGGRGGEGASHGPAPEAGGFGTFGDLLRGKLPKKR